MAWPSLVKKSLPLRLKMISSNETWDAFITEHRWAVLTGVRANGSPVSSVVAYARDGDDLVVSTPGKTFKRSFLEKNPTLNLCIISNQEPFNFVAIEGTASVNKEDLKRRTRLVFENIEETGYQVPDDLEHWLESQDRVIITIQANRIHGVIR